MYWYTEGLINNLKCPIIVITRNTIYVVDNESSYFKNRHFFPKFLPENKERIIENLEKYPIEGEKRINVIIGTALIVAVLNRMLKQPSEEYGNLKYIYYEDLCLYPLEVFSECAHSLI